MSAAMPAPSAAHRWADLPHELVQRFASHLDGWDRWAGWWDAEQRGRLWGS